jgi:hypothetical protein
MATTAALALASFLALSAFTSHRAPIPCCSKCERCVSSVCQDPPANTSVKTELAAPMEIAVPFVLLRPLLSRLAPASHPAHSVFLPGVDPPMRS